MNAAPGSPAEIFLAFNRLALQGFGGVLPVAQRELVERLHWLDRASFLELLSLAQVLPGPNIVNLAVIYGDRCMGWRGALAALGGLMLAPLAVVLMLTLAVRWGQSMDWIGNALRGMAVVSAGLVLGIALKSATVLRRNPLGWPVCAALAATVALLVGMGRWPLAAVLLSVGPLAVIMAWFRMRRPKG